MIALFLAFLGAIFLSGLETNPISFVSEVASGIHKTSRLDHEVARLSDSAANAIQNVELANDRLEKLKVQCLALNLIGAIVEAPLLRGIGEAIALEQDFAWRAWTLSSRTSGDFAIHHREPLRGVPGACLIPGSLAWRSFGHPIVSLTWSEQPSRAGSNVYLSLRGEAYWTYHGQGVRAL